MMSHKANGLKFVLQISAVSLLSYVGFAFLNPSFSLALESLGFSLMQTGVIASLGGAALVLASLVGNRVLRNFSWQKGLPLTLAISILGHLGFAGVTALVAHHLIPLGIAFVLLTFLRAVVAFGFALTQIAILRALSEQQSHTGYSGNTAATALGIVLGPILGGVVAGWVLFLPIYSVFVFSLAGFLLCLPLRRSHSEDMPDDARKIMDRKGWYLVVIPALLAIIIMSCLSSMQIVLPLHIGKILGILPETSAVIAGYGLFWGGIGLVLSNVFLMIIPKQSAHWTFVVATLIAAVGFIMLAQATGPMAIYAGLCVVGLGLGPAIPAYTRLTTGSIGADGSAVIVLSQSVGLMVGPYCGVLLFQNDMLFETNAAVLVLSNLLLIGVVRRR